MARSPEGVEVCKECGGFGLIKKERDSTAGSKRRSRKMKTMPNPKKNRPLLSFQHPKQKSSLFQVSSEPVQCRNIVDGA